MRCVRDQVVEHLGDSDAVLVVDETGFLRKGSASCGVERQYTGSAGKITNCQIGVFAAYVSDKRHAFLDRALYLPKAWTEKPERLAAAHVPGDVQFASKPSLATAMIGRALAADVPFRWVSGDSVYGVGELEMALRRAGRLGPWHQRQSRVSFLASGHPLVRRGARNHQDPAGRGPDPWAAGAAQSRRWRSGVFHDLVPSGNAARDIGACRGHALAY
uniref:IS701 family transposase n=1 Tax=Gluconacetobacter tumulisoli TaxID=1286189 RepID=UPI0038D1FA5C